MNYLHYEIDVDPNDSTAVIEVVMDRSANVLLLDDSNYENYQTGKTYRYWGGLARESPVRLVPPRSGHWHVVINLGGFPGTVRASVRKIAAPQPVG